MKFISPSFEIMSIPEPTDKWGVLKHLEQIGRVCYKSEEKITEDSCIKFLENIKKRKHWAMLEHYVFVMEVSDEIYSSIYNDMLLFDNISYINHRLKYLHMSTHKGSAGAPVNLISGSPTTFNYLWETFDGVSEYHGILEVCNFLYSKYPEIIMKPKWGDNYHVRSKEDDVKFFSIKEIDSIVDPHNPRAIDIRSIHQTMTVKFITDRGVSHELVRHRPASWAHESTRYCNYGVKGCTFIIPGWMNNREHQILEDATQEEIAEIIHPNNLYGLDLNTREWVAAMLMANNTYNVMLKNGWTPQQARSVLPNSIKTEIIMTANLHEWYHFFDMRADTPAHPQMKELSYPLLRKVNDLVPDVFIPLVKRAMEQGAIK